jgi:hypothetical protein
MKVYEKVKTFIEEKSQYWFIVAAIFIILEIANYGFLSIVTTKWVCASISIILTLVATFYIAIMYKYVCNKCKDYLTNMNGILLERVDLFEIHMNEMNDKNMELDNKLAIAIQDRVDVNTNKTISELTSSIVKSSDTIEKQISTFEDNMNIRINQETENTKTYIREEFASQERLAINNTEEIIKKTDNSTTSISESINTCSTNTYNMISNLSVKIEEFRKDEKDNTGEVINAVTEHSVKITKLLSDNHLENEKWIYEQNESIQDSIDKLEDKIKDESITNTASVEEINNNINSLADDLRTDTLNVNTNINEQSDRIAKIISDKTSHDDSLNLENVKLLTSINETIILTGEVEKSAIANEAERIIQNANENRAAQEVFMSDQKTCLNDANENMCVRIDEMAFTGKELVKDLSDSIIALANIVNNSTEGIQATTIQQAQQIMLKINEKVIRDDEEQQVIKELIGSDTERIATGLIDQAERIISRINEKVVIDTEIQNNNVNFMMELKERIEEIGTENQTASSNDTEKIITALEDFYKEQEENHNQQKVNNEKLSAQIEQKTLSIIDTNVRTSNSVNILLNEMKNIMSADVKRLTGQATDNTAELISKMYEINQQENSTIESAVERIERKFAETSDIEKDLLENVVSSLVTLDESIGSGNTKISDDLSKHIELVISGIDELSELERQTSDAQDKKLNDLNNQIASIKQYAGEKTEKLSSKTSEIQNELTKILVQILNNFDDSAENVNSVYDRLFNQVLGFSNTTKASIDKLQQALEIENQLIENDNIEITSAMSEQLIQTQSLSNKVDTYSRVAEKNNSEIAARLENLQNQILNLNSIAEVLKNVSADDRTAIAYQEPSKQKTPKVNPNRTEEIKDAESGVTVFNYYKANILVSSEMVSGKKKTYDVEYDSVGRITRSRNYGPGGDVVTELQFYPNGQVKTRTEKIKVNGKIQMVISKFNEHGNKI